MLTLDECRRPQLCPQSLAYSEVRAVLFWEKKCYFFCPHLWSPAKLLHSPLNPLCLSAVTPPGPAIVSSLGQGEMFLVGACFLLASTPHIQLVLGRLFFLFQAPCPAGFPFLGV